MDIYSKASLLLYIAIRNNDNEKIKQILSFVQASLGMSKANELRKEFKIN